MPSLEFYMEHKIAYISKRTIAKFGILIKRTFMLIWIQNKLVSSKSPQSGYENSVESNTLSFQSSPHENIFKCDWWKHDY
jgi:hypothetical protein